MLKKVALQAAGKYYQTETQIYRKKEIETLQIGIYERLYLSCSSLKDIKRA